MTSVSGIYQKLEPPSWRKPLGGDDGHILLHAENRDNGAAHSEREINADVHKLTILNFPEEVDEYEKQTSSVPSFGSLGVTDSWEETKQTSALLRPKRKMLF